MNEKDRMLMVSDYKEDRVNACAELSDRTKCMIRELEQLKQKTDWASNTGRRVNIDTHNITMLMSTMMMMVNTAERIAKDNEILMALGELK